MAPPETLPTERPLNEDAGAYDGGVQEEQAVFDLQAQERLEKKLSLQASLKIDGTYNS